MTEGRDPPSREGPPPPEVARWLIIGLFAYPVLAAALAFRFSFSLLDAFFLAALLELLPVLAIAQLPLVRTGELERVPAYVASGLTVSVLGLLATLLGARRTGLAGLGLQAESLVTVAVWTAGLVGATLLLVLALDLARRRLGWTESPVVRELLPGTRHERAVFVLLAFAAGVGEELAFRGYAISALSPHLGGAWGAAVFTSLVFGLLHAYQGPLGMARAAALGLLLAASLVLSGTLWPAILAHVILDLIGGLVLGERLAR